MECIDQLRHPQNIGYVPGNQRALTKVPRERSPAPQACLKSRREKTRERNQNFPPPQHLRTISVFSLHGLELVPQEN